MYKCKFMIKHYLSEMSSMGFACKFIYSLLAGRLLCLLAESLHVCFYAALTQWVVSFRASVEEKYAKELLSLSKKVCGHSEMK